MNLDNLCSLLDESIKVTDFRFHAKASEKYVDVIITNPDDFVWKGSIPYFYRRTGIFISDENELAEYLKKIKPQFAEASIREFLTFERERWETEMSGKKTTAPFFLELLNLRWNSVKGDLPQNPNWSRRIQDIKELGYTLATNTRMQIRGSNEKGTHILLVPLSKSAVTGYEVLSASLKKRVIAALNSINVYELSNANRLGLLPDHKFPEIRWDKETRDLNNDLTDEEIRAKFQLIDNQRNQQKREVCRRCFQTGERGKIFGINYYYSGSNRWPEHIPSTGKAAEAGCVGCPWYDIAEWRLSLNRIVEEKPSK